jgi:DNA repair protein RadC
MNQYIDNTDLQSCSADFWEDLKSGRFAAMIKESSKGQSLSNASETYNILKPFFARHDDVEKMYGIFLDAKNRIITIEELFSGSITSSVVYPREIVKWVLKLKAVSVIISHNHPSGDTTPSPEDKKITTRIFNALACINVPLHDHLIVGDDYYSFAEKGLIDKTRLKHEEFFS